MNRRNFFGLLVAAPLAPLVTVGITSDGWDKSRSFLPVAYHPNELPAAIGIVAIRQMQQRECILPAKLAAQIRSASLQYKGSIGHVQVSSQAMNSKEIADLIRRSTWSTI